MQAAQEPLDDGARDELEVPDPSQNGGVQELESGECVAAHSPDPRAERERISQTFITNHSWESGRP